MWPNLTRDFQRVYRKSGYRGRVRKTIHTLTLPGFQAVCGYRASRWCLRRRIPLIGAILQRLVEVWTGISIPPEATIGPGLLLLHFGGIVVNGDAVLGDDCTLRHGVTIGNRTPGGPSPTVGDRVMVGAGAMVLGGITVGHDVEIGASAVLVQSLPDGAIAVGIPARIVRIKQGLGMEVATGGPRNR